MMIALTLSLADGRAEGSGQIFLEMVHVFLEAHLPDPVAHTATSFLAWSRLVLQASPRISRREKRARAELTVGVRMRSLFREPEVGLRRVPFKGPP